MGRYVVTVELEVEAGSKEQAWELVADPFRNGSIRNDQPHWLRPIVNEPILLDSNALQPVGNLTA